MRLFRTRLREFAQEPSPGFAPQHRRDVARQQRHYWRRAGNTGAPLHPGGHDRSRHRIWWGKAGQQSLARSAFVEAIEQLTRALNQITSLPDKPELRREQIKLQVALLHALGQVKGFAALETKGALDRARSLIERAEALGEAPPRLFSVLFGGWVTNYIAFNGEVMRELAAQFLAVAESKNPPSNS